MNFSLSDEYFKGAIYSFAKTNHPRLKLSVTSNHSSNYDMNKIVDYETPDAHWASIFDESLQQHLTISFTNNQYFYITHYSLMSHYYNPDIMRSWDFSGSIDGYRWTTLHSVIDSSDLESNGIGLYEINPINNYFSLFRIHMTNHSSSGNAQMRIMKIDLFGYLFIPNICSRNPIQHYYFQSIYFIILIKIYTT